MVARPARDEVVAYRGNVEAALLDALPGLPPEVRDLVALGCHHEEQHQELLLTDILHLLSCNPIEPTLWPAPRQAPMAMPGAIGWIEGVAATVEIGHGGGGFAFDCEGPRHAVLRHPQDRKRNRLNSSH